jgi:hypothetical protein
VVEEAPVGFGFGGAAIRMVEADFALAPTAARPPPGATIRLPITFQLGG